MRRFLIFLLIFIYEIHSELVLLLAIWRHGDRAPDRLPYPNDQNDEETWPRGWEQLTNLGISQGYELGTFLRKRYAGQLFSRQFNRKEVLVRSSDSERAIETAQAVMAGLFPAEGNRMYSRRKDVMGIKSYRWNASTGWQPTPIHTNGKGRDDPLLKPTSVYCPNYEHVRYLDFQRLEKKLDDKYGSFFDWLRTETGMNVTVANVKKLYDVNYEILHSLPQPDWVYTNWEGERVLSLLKELKRITRLEDFNTFTKAKFRGGYLLNDWLSKIEAIEIGKRVHKAVLYSSHDGTLNSLMYAMGVANHQLIPFAACFFIEVVRDETNDLYLQIFYRNTTSNEPQILKLPHCSIECPIADFVRLLDSSRIRSDAELRMVCSVASNKVSLILTIIISIIFQSFERN